MARKFRTGIIIEGDSKGGVKAIKATEGELKKLDRQSKRNTDTAKRLSRSYENVRASATRMAAVGGVAAAGVAALASRQIEAFRETDALSQALGVSIGRLQEYQYAAESVGVSGEKMGDILKDTSDKIGDAYANQGGEAYEVLQNLGLSAENLINLSPDQQLLAIAQALQGMPKGVQVNALESLGDDASRLLPLLQNGGEALRRTAQEARDYNVALSEGDASKLREASEQMHQLRGVAQGLANQVTIGTTPAIKSLTDTLTDPDVQSGITDMANALLTVTQKAVQAVTMINNVTKSLAEGLAADVHGAAIGDTSRIENQIKRLQELRNTSQYNPQRYTSFGNNGGLGYQNYISDSEIDTQLQKLRKRLELSRDFKKSESEPVPPGPASTATVTAKLPSFGTRSKTASDSQNEKQRELNRLIDQQNSRLKESARIGQTIQQQLNDRVQGTLDQLRTPQQKAANTYHGQLANLRSARDGGLINQQQYIQKASIAWDQYEQSAKRATDNASIFSRRSGERIQDTLGDSLNASLSGNFSELRDMWLSTVQQMANDALAANLNNALFGKEYGQGGDLGGLLGKVGGAIAGSFGGGVSTSTTTSLADAGINVGGTKSLLGYAKGGVANEPSIFGEAGPEAAVPLPDGRRIPVDMRGQPNGDTNVNLDVQIVNEGGAQIQETGRQESNVNGKKQLRIMVRSELNDMARTGELSEPLSRYDTRRSTKL